MCIRDRTGSSSGREVRAVRGSTGAAASRGDSGTGARSDLRGGAEAALAGRARATRRGGGGGGGGAGATAGGASGSSVRTYATSMRGGMRAAAANPSRRLATCLLYTSDAADERSSVDLGGRRI